MFGISVKDVPCRECCSKDPSVITLVLLPLVRSITSDSNATCTSRVIAANDCIFMEGKDLHVRSLISHIFLSHPHLEKIYNNKPLQSISFLCKCHDTHIPGKACVHLIDISCSYKKCISSPSAPHTNST